MRVVRGEVYGQKRTGVAVLQPELCGIGAVHAQGRTAWKPAHQRGGTGGMEGETDQGEIASKGGETVAFLLLFWHNSNMKKEVKSACGWQALLQKKEDEIAALSRQAEWLTQQLRLTQGQRADTGADGADMPVQRGGGAGG